MPNPQRRARWLPTHTWLGVLLAFVLSACGASAPRGKAWLELTTPHYRMHTDLMPAQAQEMAQALEEARRALLISAWPDGKPIDGHTEAVVFADEEAFHKYVQMPGAAGVLFGTPGRIPLLAIYWAPDAPGGLPEHAVHEVAHDLDRWHSPVGPLWLREGIATYLEGMTYEPENARVILGELPSYMEKELRSFGRKLMPVEKLLAAPGAYHSRNVWRLYFTTWLLTLWLNNHHGEAFADFRQDLSHEYDWHLAWQKHFPRLTPKALDEKLSEYMAGGQFQRRARTMKPVRHEVRTRVLSPAEGLGVSSWLALQTKNEDLAKKEAERALELDPHEHSALLTQYHLAPQPKVGRVFPAATEETANAEVATEGTQTEGGQSEDAATEQAATEEAKRQTASVEQRSRLERARELVRLHPQSAEAWLTLWESARSAEERSAALERAGQLAPHHPGVREGLAQRLLETGDASAALEQTGWLIRRVAVTGRTVRLHALALGAAGQCGKAMEFVRAWLGLLSDASSDNRVWPGYFSGVLSRAGCDVTAAEKETLWASLFQSERVPAQEVP